MPSANHKGHRGSFHARDELRNGETCFHIAADGVEDYKQPLNAPVLLDSHKGRDYVFVFCGLVLLREDVVPFYLTDDGQAVYEML